MEKTTWRFLKNIKLELPYNPLFWVYIQKNRRVLSLRTFCTSIFIVALIHSHQEVETTQNVHLGDDCKTKIVYISNGVLSNLIRGNFVTDTTWMNLEVITSSK